MLTHTQTHWRKSRYGFSGLNSSQDLILLGQKCHESTAQQGFDHRLAVGKDEVGGSNPPSSSTRNPVTAMVTGSFLFSAPPCFPRFWGSFGVYLYESKQAQTKVIEQHDAKEKPRELTSCGFFLYFFSCHFLDALVKMIKTEAKPLVTTINIRR